MGEKFTLTLCASAHYCQPTGCQLARLTVMGFWKADALET